MPIKDIGFYDEPEKVGFHGWIKTIDGTYFIGLDGVIKKAD
jgi:hypothetical protein